MTTIYQVAERAGVSLSTVSRVMNGNKSVNKELKRKVEQAMLELNYRPSSVARSLANSRTDSVGILVSELNTPFFGDLMQAIESTLRAADKHAIITVGHNNLANEQDAVEFLISRNCDALIMHVEAMSDSYIRELNAKQIPVSVVNRTIEGMENSCINLDNEKGGYMATQHLIGLGHKSIAYIAGPTNKQDAILRLKGHKQAMLNAGLDDSDALVYYGSYQEQDGKEGFLELLSRNQPFSALVCANDWMASGAMSCARDLGIQLPQELSIIGFDDVVFASHLYPRLTTIKNPIYQMGEMAARHILNVVYQQKQEVAYQFAPSIIVRDSTKKL